MSLCQLSHWRLTSQNVLHWCYSVKCSKELFNSHTILTSFTWQNLSGLYRLQFFIPSELFNSDTKHSNEPVQHFCVYGRQRQSREGVQMILGLGIPNFCEATTCSGRLVRVWNPMKNVVFCSETSSQASPLSAILHMTKLARPSLSFLCTISDHELDGGEELGMKLRQWTTHHI